MRRARRISGGLAVALGLLIVIAGAAAAAYVGPDDTVRSAPERIATDTAAAVITNELFRYVGPNVHVTITGHDDAEVFAGVGPAEDVADYLGGVQHEVIRVAQLPFTPRPEPGEGTAGALRRPIDFDLWVASIQGAGTREMIWPSTDGDWRVVLMRADGAEGLDVTVVVGFEMPQLFVGALTAVLSGLAAMVGGFLLMRGQHRRPVELPEQRGFDDEPWFSPAPANPAVERTQSRATGQVGQVSRTGQAGQAGQSGGW